MEEQRARVASANRAYSPETAEQYRAADEAMVVRRGGQAAPHAAVPMGAAGVQTAELRNPYAGDPQAESQMRMQSALSPQEYAVLQNLLAEADRWHGTNEAGGRFFTGRRGMTPDEQSRIRMRGGKPKMVSEREANREDVRMDERRQRAARMESERAAREDREAAAAPGQHRRELMRRGV